MEYTIEVLKNVNNTKFDQLKELIKEFAINVFIVQKYNLSNESNIVKKKYIENYDKMLTKEELDILRNDVEERIKFAENSILSKNNKKKTRYYILIKDGNVVAFQTAQVRFENEKVEGWRNFAYIKEEYIGKRGIVIDTYSKENEGFLSDVIYENITKWFQENNVKIERTATGKNMNKNILAYIIYKGFVPEKVDDTRVYLIKDYSKNISKKELKEIYKDYLEKNIYKRSNK